MIAWANFAAVMAFAAMFAGYFAFFHFVRADHRLRLWKRCRERRERFYENFRRLTRINN